MKILEDGSIRLTKYCERCHKLVNTVIPNNILYWIWGMDFKWECLYCGHIQENFADDLNYITPALQKVYNELHK
jgi:hypothetical protein